MGQIYIPYNLWEDYYAGMWRDIYGQEREEYIKKAIIFTGDAKKYGSFMQKVVRKWVYACVNALTNPSMNHQAFIGHCACCLAFGCPEDITRLAWHQLTQEQQDAANLEADKAIEYWFRQYKRGIQPCLKLD